MYNNRIVTVSLEEYESNAKRMKSMKEKIKFLESENPDLVMVKVDQNEYYFKKSDEAVKEVNTKLNDLVEKSMNRLELQDKNHKSEIQSISRERWNLTREKEMIKQENFDLKIKLVEIAAKQQKMKYALIIVASILTLALGLAIAL